jgi:membrane protein DedA with SNARE-associated domain
VDSLAHSVELPHGLVLYLIVGAVVVVSGLPMASLLVPAEPILMIATVLIGQNLASMWALLAATVVASVVGDTVGYLLGRRYGSRLLRRRGVRKHRTRLRKAQHTIQRRGMLSVILQRWVPPGRGFVPFLIGGARLPLRRFFPFATAAGIVWATTFVVGGWLGGVTFMVAAPAVILPLAVGIPLAIDIVRRRSAAAGHPDSPA